MSATPYNPTAHDPAASDDVLLLYAAGELSADDRRSVDRRLAADPGLRERLGEIEAMVVRVDAALAASDAVPLSADVGRAAARAADAVRAWQVKRGGGAGAAGPAKVRRPTPGRVVWAAPTAAAAGIVLLLSGVLLMRHWPQGGGRGGEEGGGRGGPVTLSIWPSEEERDFHLGALRQLAGRSTGLVEEADGSNGPAPYVPGPLVPGPLVPEPVASAARTETAAAVLDRVDDEPFFDVPLSADATP